MRSRFRWRLRVGPPPGSGVCPTPMNKTRPDPNEELSLGYDTAGAPWPGSLTMTDGHACFLKPRTAGFNLGPK